MRPSAFAAAVLFLFLAPGPGFAEKADPAVSRAYLALQSGSTGNPNGRAFAGAFSDAVRAGDPRARVFFRDYEAYLSPGEARRAASIEALESEFAEVGIAAVAAVDTPSIQLLIDAGPSFLAGIPAVAVGGPESLFRELRLQRPALRIADAEILERAAVFALALSPAGGRHLVVLDTKHGAGSDADIIRTVLGGALGPQVDYLENADLEAIADAVRGLPPGAWTFLLSFPYAQDGAPIPPEVYVPVLAGAGRPVFAFTERPVELGLAAGLAVDFAARGAAAGKEALLFARGEGRDGGSVLVDPVAVVNYPAAVAAGIDPRRIPVQARVFGRPLPFAVRYAGPIAASAAAVALAAVILGLLAVQRGARLRQAARYAAELETRVAERTADLATANEELEASNENLVAALRRAEIAQDGLLAAERKVMAYGLAARLAHELNSPIAALLSSASTARSSLRGVESAASGVLSSAEARRIADALAWTDGRDALDLPAPSEGRRRSADLRAAAAAAGLGGDLAERLAALPSNFPVDFAASLAASGRPSEIVDAAESLSSLRLSLAVAEKSALGAKSVVEALSTFLAPASALYPPADIARAVASAAERLEPAKRACVRFSLEPAAPVPGDEAALSLVVGTLLDASLRGASEVSVSSGPDGAGVRVAFESTRPGGPPESLGIGAEGFKNYPTTSFALLAARKLAEDRGGSVAAEDSGGFRRLVLRLPALAEKPPSA